MTHAGLLGHFDSKEELLLAALHDAAEREREQIDIILAAGASDREAIEAVMRIRTADLPRARR